MVIFLIKTNLLENLVNLMDKENILFVIPARSGSKGLPNKNVFFWKDKPLTMHSYDYLINQNIDPKKIVITTDSEEYAEIFIKYGVRRESILLRPSCLAEDNVVDYPVILHAWSYMENINKEKYQFITLIRPTSPIRPKNLIERGINLIKENKELTSIRAMRKVKEHPNRIWVKEDKIAKPIIQNINEPGNIPRQFLSMLYYYQSGELEIVRRNTLQMGSISGDNVGILEIYDDYPDIDSTNDF